MTPFVKQCSSPQQAATEAAGLNWLRVANGCAVVDVVAVRDNTLELDRIASASPSREAAADFGRALAVTHAAGAESFGELPPDAQPIDDATWIGMATLPTGTGESWGAFYAKFRIEPYVRMLRDRAVLSAADVAVFDAACTRLVDGDQSVCGPDESVARIHGDLWSGNVLWDNAGGTVAACLIDPAAHGGHRETDLAMLALFGLPYLDVVIAAYDEHTPLADHWRERVPVHQLHPLLVHAVLFGGGYVQQAFSAAHLAANL